MNCYEHPIQPAVAQCPDCGKGLCADCASTYSEPICKKCNAKRINSERVQIITEMLLTYGVGILLGVLFVRCTNEGLSFHLVYAIVSYGMPIYIFFKYRSRLENIDENYSGCFPVYADFRLGALFYHKTCAVTLSRTCDAADKNG